MKDGATSAALLEHNNRELKRPDIDYGTESKSTTETTEKRRTLTRKEAFRVDPTTNTHTKHRHYKKQDQIPLTTDHENEWSNSIKDDPNSGEYDTDLNTFIKDNLSRTVTHDFQNDEQQPDLQLIDAKEKESLTDAELVEYFAERMRTLPLIYGFKTSERYDIMQKAMSVNHDKDTHVTSRLHETRHRPTVHASTETSRHNSFKSKSKEKFFLPKINSTPSDHDHQTNTSTGPVITSSFRSGTDRFPRKIRKIPGPGMYDRLFEYPTQKQLVSFLSRGIYFSSSFT
ncbi:unnamed protein product [Adineta steineri]|uniref:Uncharacterized protein n=1 Tax=Adineta steineri TaxID=433720 RepID=A0A813PBN1_9BILA|nr:unnamed protein product [Adineta steineri]CAF1406455.1 unnamed protein product [Adineta steineri]